jgi:hypothetical protein
MWSSLIALWRWSNGRPTEATATAARRALEGAYPDLEVVDVWLRARERDRDVVAVLHCARGAAPNLHPRGCPRYKLFAVRRDRTSEELPRDEGSPYVIRGIK